MQGLHVEQLPDRNVWFGVVSWVLSIIQIMEHVY